MNKEQSMREVMQPVAETVIDCYQDHEGRIEALAHLPSGTKLYAAPQPAAQQTDMREIANLVIANSGDDCSMMLMLLDMGQRVAAAYGTVDATT